MFHLFHKWIVVSKYPGTARNRHLNDEMDVMGVIEKCSVCGKERGIMKTINNSSTVIDPDFIRMNIEKNVE